MKQLILIVLSFILLSSSCRKNKSGNPVDQLPPETQTGANTFGCLIDGQVFKPKGGTIGAPVLTAGYQLLIGGYHLSVGATDRSNSTKSTTVIIGADSVKLNIGTYSLSKYRVKGFLGGGVVYSEDNQLPKRYYTNNIQVGQVVIKKMDEINQIISGTFWFDAIDTNSNKTVQIRDGRFDLQYVE